MNYDVPDELWTEIRDIVQGAGIKTIPKKKKCKKAKWLSEEDLQIAEKRRDAKTKEEVERCIHLNAEFQGIAWKDKKAFLSDQCKEIKRKTVEWEQPHGLQSTRLLCPWDFPGKSTGVGCHCLLQK